MTAPTLVVHGTHDRLSPPLNGRLLARLIPGARLHLLDRCGHFLITDAGDEVAAVIGRFLSASAASHLAGSPARQPLLGRPALPATV